jgi:hypothetical protein
LAIDGEPRSSPQCTEFCALTESAAHSRAHELEVALDGNARPDAMCVLIETLPQPASGTTGQRVAAAKSAALGERRGPIAPAPARRTLRLRLVRSARAAAVTTSALRSSLFAKPMNECFENSEARPSAGGRRDGELMSAFGCQAGIRTRVHAPVAAKADGDDAELCASLADVDSAANPDGNPARPATAVASGRGPAGARTTLTHRQQGAGVTWLIGMSRSSPPDGKR